MDDWEKMFALFFGFIIVVLAFVCVIGLSNHTVTHVGVLEQVKVDRYDVTIVLEDDVFTVHLSGNQILQPPLEIGHKYQIDTTEAYGLSPRLVSITELPIE